MADFPEYESLHQCIAEKAVAREQTSKTGKTVGVLLACGVNPWLCLGVQAFVTGPVAYQSWKLGTECEKAGTLCGPEEVKRAKELKKEAMWDVGLGIAGAGVGKVLKMTVKARKARAIARATTQKIIETEAEKALKVVTAEREAAERAVIKEIDRLEGIRALRGERSYQIASSASGNRHYHTLNNLFDKEVQAARRASFRTIEESERVVAAAEYSYVEALSHQKKISDSYNKFNPGQWLPSEHTIFLTETAKRNLQIAQARRMATWVEKRGLTVVEQETHAAVTAARSEVQVAEEEVQRLKQMRSDGEIKDYNKYSKDLESAEQRVYSAGQRVEQAETNARDFKAHKKWLESQSVS